MYKHYAYFMLSLHCAAVLSVLLSIKCLRWVRQGKTFLVSLKKTIFIYCYLYNYTFSVIYL